MSVFLDKTYLAKASSSFNNPANYCRSGNSNFLYNKCVRSALLFDTLISKLCFVDRLRKHSNAEWSLFLFIRVNSKATLAKRLTQTLQKGNIGKTIDADPTQMRDLKYRRTR